MIKIKYCGLTTLDDVNNAIDADVDAVGFVFVKHSKRFIESAQAAKLIDVAKKAGLITVALFADQAANEISTIIQLTEPDILQFHGNESAAHCEQFDWPYWKAIPMLGEACYMEIIKHHPNAEAFLVDAYGANQSGGSGNTFQWFEFPEILKSKLILAGGINENNVHEALIKTGARYVDTSSGIESSPGVKSSFKMMALAKKIKSQCPQITA